MTMENWESFFEEFYSFISSLGGGRVNYANETYTEYVLERLGVCRNSLTVLLEHFRSIHLDLEDDEQEVVEFFSLQLSQLLDCLQQIFTEWQVHFDQLQLQNSMRVTTNTSFQSSSHPSNGPGRPRFDISRDQVQYLSSLSFTWPQIAQLLGVSRMTLYRRRREFDLLVDHSASITDAELMTTVHTLWSEHPEVGETMVWGHLRSMGIQATRDRV